MTKTTPPPRVNVLDTVPELARLAATTIRLHPRRGEVSNPAASKIGGTFLWPDDESWPTMPSRRPRWWATDVSLRGWQWNFPDDTAIALVPVLQINAADVPDFSFPVGKDLLQILWFPLNIDQPPYHAVSHIVWRNSQSIHAPLSAIPPSPFADPTYIPKPCYLTFEQVQEFPDILELPPELANRIRAWQGTLKDVVVQDEQYQDIDMLYSFELSTCPGSKLGGHVNWLQDPEYPTCTNGHRMEHLLTLTDTEVDSGTWPRWLPLEDRNGWRGAYAGDDRVDAPEWIGLGGGSVYYFVCRTCADWPIETVYQR